jgi:hypothetical protein
MVGAVVSITVTVWLQRAAFVQASTASQIRIALKVLPQAALVVVLTMRSVTLLPSAMSVALGALKVQAVPHSMILSATHVRVGGVESITVTD